VIGGIHAEYLAAGADIIETNSFNGTRVSQAEYGLEELAYELNVAAARLARETADKLFHADKPRFVAGVLGPTSRTASLSPDVNDPGARNITFDQLVADYVEAARGLTAGGADILLVETVFDTLNAKAALFAIEKFFDEAGRRWPVMISGTITDASGRTLSGQTAEAFWNSLRHARPLSFGLNCALGAKELRQYVEELSKLCDCHHLGPSQRRPAECLRRLRRDAASWPTKSPTGARPASSTSPAAAAAPRPITSAPSPSAEGAAPRRPASADFRCACRASKPATSATTACSSTSASAPTSPARKPSPA
jgi:hypothetical protein